MKKSIPFSEFKKKSLHYNKITEGLSPEQVERLVKLFMHLLFMQKR